MSKSPRFSGIQEILVPAKKRQDWPNNQGYASTFRSGRLLHSPVYQRDIDVKAGIYWINTSRPLADKLREKEGANSARWREYSFNGTWTPEAKGQGNL